MSNRNSTVLLLLLALAGFAVRAEPPAASVQPELEPARSSYWKAHEALSAGDYLGALERFRQLERELKDAGQRGADSAAYWQAYTLHMARRRAEAGRAAERMLHEYPQSALAAEARALRSGSEAAAAAAGLAGLAALPAKPVDRSGDHMQAADPDEQRALDAIDALLAGDAARAVPVLERVLDSTHSDQVKTRALFVLVQLDPKAAEQRIGAILAANASVDLKREAVKMIAFGSEREALDRLESVYLTQQDAALRHAVLEAWMIGNRADLLATAAARETDADLRREAVNLIGVLGRSEALDALWRGSADPALREQVAKALGLAGDVARLASIAASETEPEVLRAAIDGLGVAGGEAAESALAGIYRGARDSGTRRMVIHGFIITGRAGSAIELYRSETDPDLKRELLHAITLIDDDAAMQLVDRALQR